LRQANLSVTTAHVKRLSQEERAICPSVSHKSSTADVTRSFVI
jgi:hypothetical protein